MCSSTKNIYIYFFFHISPLHHPDILSFLLCYCPFLVNVLVLVLDQEGGSDGSFRWKVKCSVPAAGFRELVIEFTEKQAEAKILFLRLQACHFVVGSQGWYALCMLPAKKCICPL